MRQTTKGPPIGVGGKVQDNMAANQGANLLKVTQFSKDINMKSKDVLEVLSDKGITLKSSSTLDEQQFALLLDTLTKNNQLDNIGSYLGGATYIPSKKKASAAKAETEAAVAKKESAPAEQQPKVKAADAEAPKAQEAPKAEKSEKTAEKAEKKQEKPAEKPIEKVEKKEEKPIEKPTATVEKKEEKPAEAVQPKKAETPKQPSAVQDQKNIVKKAPSAPATSRAPEERAPKQDSRPTAAPSQQGGFGTQRPQGDRPYGQRPQGSAQQGGFGTQRPQGDRPYGQRPQGAQGTQGQNRAPFGGGQQGGFGGQRPQSGGFGGQKDRGARQGGGFGQGFDKDERQQHGPRETFKPQAIVREGAQRTGEKRVVDLRGGNVDLGKYDDKFGSFVSDSVADARGGNQRVKKQAPANNRAPATFGKGKDKFKGKKSSTPVTKAPTGVTLPEEIMVSDLASRLKVTSAEVVKRLMLLGMMVTVNQTVDYDTAAIVAEEMGISATKEVVVTIEEKLFEEETDSEENLSPRAPVVCVMGHVDHGKTSILDAIRHTNVTTGEAGGITQHIGAYRVKAQGQDITFLDTPGHEAFTAMRARGAQATDIAILVVAADDGIMPQTIEAINHAKAAGIDIIVAINKMDKPTANPDAVKQELTKYDLVPEEWGGDVICVPVSALTGFGISDLLDNVLLVAEVKELKANPKRRAKGIVIEAKLDKGRGPVATVLVQNGTLHNGDIVIAGTSVGRVRAMTDHNGRNLKEAGPSVPVEIIGLAEVPSSGDEFNAVEDERMARELADQRRAKAKEEEFKANARANLNDLFAQIKDGVKQLNVIVKADVGGSAEAVKQSLEKISNDEVKVCVIHAAAGGIREGDVTFAAASNAIIVGFNVRPDKVALDSAERQNVDIRTYRVIYDCINEITDAMKGMLAPEFKEVLLGHAEVRQTIHVPNVGTIAGSYVQDGKVTRAAMIRVVRDGVVIFEDKISSLRRFKDDVREVAQGYECGIGLDRFNDIKVGDVLEAYVMEEIAR